MAHLTNAAELQSVHVILLGMGSEILDTLKVPRHDVAIQPLDRKSIPEGEKANAITITLLRNGKPSTDEPAREEAMAQIARLIARRHPTERDAVDQEGLTIIVKAAVLEADREKKRVRDMARGATTDRKGLLKGHGEQEESAGKDRRDEDPGSTSNEGEE